MINTTLGRTGLTVCKDGFGALPIQRTDMDTAVKILRAAFDGGINFFDSARAYSDSEEKLGYALSSVRNRFILATKTGSTTTEGFWKDLETSLSLLKTDHIDVYQFHNPAACPKPEDGTGLYEAMLDAKKQGKIRFIGITNHRLPVAQEAVESGLYDTLQFPFNYLSNEAEIALSRLCVEKNVGFIAMKALSGGLITDIGAARSWLNQFANVVPIWGIQRKKELEELFTVLDHECGLSQTQQSRIDHDRKELIGEFCRGCGYCMPCPTGIVINMCARMPLLLRRAPEKTWLSPQWQTEMAKIPECKHCGYCKAHCPYGLNTPELLEKSYRDYQTFLK